jgi:Ca2+:H+ antiporter
MVENSRLPWLSWTTVAPPLGIVALGLAWGRDLGALGAAAVAVVLIAAVLAAVHHAEMVALRVGEPYGSLVLAVAVTVIEVALIVTLMVSGGPDAASLARDTVFAAVMITTNGIVGLSLLVGARRYGVTLFNPEGSGAALATVTTLATLAMVLPSFTASRPGPMFSPGQLAFAALASAVLYVLFVLTQTVRHRDFFLPVDTRGGTRPAGTGGQRTGTDGQQTGTEDDHHAAPPSRNATFLSLGLLLVALVAVVGLAKLESPAIESLVRAAGFPQSFVGVVIALVVLLPETIAAVRAALRNRLQISLNLGYGSAIASIGLTIPAIALATVWLPGPLLLGLGATQLVLLTLTVLVSVLTVVPGRATRLQGGVHLVLLAAYLFLAVNP